MQRFILSLAFGLIGLAALPKVSQAAENARPAYVTVRVPAAAKVWFDNFATTQTGTVRHFSSPALEPSNNRYVYDVRAEWTEDGQTIKKNQRVAVRPGDRMLVQFTSAGEPQVSAMDQTTSQAYYYTPRIPARAAPSTPVSPSGAGPVYPAPSSNEWGPSMPYNFKYNGQ